MAKFTWTPDSVVELEATSSVHPIHAEIRNLRGEATCEIADGKVVADGASAWIEADVSQMETGKKLEDMALRKQIDAKKHPTVRYEVRSVDGGPEQFKLNGAFTFHGVTQEFVETCRATTDGTNIQVEGEHTFDIRDFGVQPFKILTLKIDAEVKLKVRLTGKPASSGGWG